MPWPDHQGSVSIFVFIGTDIAAAELNSKPLSKKKEEFDDKPVAVSHLSVECRQKGKRSDALGNIVSQKGSKSQDTEVTMSCSNFTLRFLSNPPPINNKHSLSFISNTKSLNLLSNTSTPFTPSASASYNSRIQCGLRELRERINAVKNTQKVAEAMKLVAAAKVRRAQENVMNGRPFAEALFEMLYYIIEQLKLEDIDVPLTDIRTVRKVALVVITGDRGLCGGFNSAIIRKAESRMAELRNIGVDFTIISVGKKGNAYFSKRPSIMVDRFIEGESFPTAKEAQVIADDVFSLFVSEEVDKVELLYTKFLSLVSSDPVIRTLLPLSLKGEVFDANANCLDAAEDELFKLTSKEGKLTVGMERVSRKKMELKPLLLFEQDPVQILDALMPLYLNSQILRALQESLASELAARMNAMSNATDNALELSKTLSVAYNRERQAKITNEILEIVAGAEALSNFD